MSTVSLATGRLEVTSEGGRAPGLLSSIRLLLAHREVVVAFAGRALRVRYKQSVIGVAWVVVQPMAMLALFVAFFGHVAHLSGGGIPYGAFAISALGPWQFVNSALNFGGLSLINEASLLRKVYFPREAPVLGSLAASLVDLVVVTGLVLLLVPFLGGHLGINLLWLPVVSVALVVPVLTVVLPLAGLGVYFRDVKYVLPFLLQFWMYASPIAYPVSEVPARWQVLYAVLNPAVGPLEGFRQVIAVGQPPDWKLLGASMATCAVLLPLGYLLFKRLEPEMADAV